MRICIIIYLNFNSAKMIVFIYFAVNCGDRSKILKSSDELLLEFLEWG